MTYHFFLALKGGPGRRVLRAVCTISGKPQVVTASELGRGGILRVAAYDPTTSMTSEVQLSKIERACFACDGENYKSWRKHLGRRLSLRRPSGSTGMETIEHERNSLRPVPRTLVLDKTVFLTACRVAAGKTDAFFLRLQGILVDAGRSLALDLYQSNMSKQCRIVLTADDLIGAGLQHCELNPQIQQAVADCDEDATPARQFIGIEREKKMICMLSGARRREIAVRQLTRQLRFTPDCDSVTFSSNDGLISSTMSVLHGAEQRQPQSSFDSALLEAKESVGSYAVGCYGYAEGFLKRRRQPFVLLHDNEPARTQPSQIPQAGARKKRAPDPAFK